MRANTRTTPRPWPLLLAAVALLCLAACRHSGADMRLLLQQVEQRNQHYESLAADTAMEQVAAFMDANGTTAERLQAHYLLGCVHRDRGEAPLALDSWQHALQMADAATTDTAECRQLCRIHAQTAALFKRQDMLAESADELQRAARYAWRAADTLGALATEGYRATLLCCLGMLDSGISVSEATSQRYRQYGHEREANTALGPAISALLTKGDYQRAAPYLQRYEHHSTLTGCDSFANPNFYLLHYYKGLYFLGTDHPDSAEASFRREAALCRGDLNNLLQAYRGLYEVYKTTKTTDSIVKYADLSYRLKDSVTNATVAPQMKHIQSLYNYTRHQQLAQAKSQEATRSRYVALLVIMAALLAVGVLLAWMRERQQRGRQHRRLLRQRYEQSLALQRQTQADVEALRQQQWEALLRQKEQQLQEQQSQLEQLHQQLDGMPQTDAELAMSPAFQRMRHLASHPLEQPTDDDWQQLERLFDEKLPTFRQKLQAHDQLSTIDYRLCMLVRMLVRMHCSVGEMVVLLGRDHPYMSKRRKLLLKRLFLQTGKPEQFDRIVQSMA